MCNSIKWLDFWLRLRIELLFFPIDSSSCVTYKNACIHVYSTEKTLLLFLLFPSITWAFQANGLRLIHWMHRIFNNFLIKNVTFCKSIIQRLLLCMPEHVCRWIDTNQNDGKKTRVHLDYRYWSRMHDYYKKNRYRN